MSSSREWSWSENQRFEAALNTYNQDILAGRWDRIVAAVGGGRTVDDIRQHYDLLIRDTDQMRNQQAAAAGHAAAGAGASNTTANGNSKANGPQTR